MGKKLGTLIRTARTDAGLTQVQLARKVPGATQTDIGRFERGEAEPTTQVVKDIAKACGVTQKSLLDAMPKSSGRSSARSSGAASKPSSSSKPSTAAKTSMRLTATEKRLVELYRKADAETRKKALSTLKGETPAGNDILSGIGGLIGDMLFGKQAAATKAALPVDELAQATLPDGESGQATLPAVDAGEPEEL